MLIDAGMLHVTWIRWKVVNGHVVCLILEHHVLTDKAQNAVFMSDALAENGLRQWWKQVEVLGLSPRGCLCSLFVIGILPIVAYV